MPLAQNMTGVIKGNAIELDQPVALPQGQHVSIQMQPTALEAERRAALDRAFGAWADDGSSLEEIFEFIRKGREGR